MYAADPDRSRCRYRFRLRDGQPGVHADRHSHALGDRNASAAAGGVCAVSDEERPDGGSGELQAHTVRLELVDEPGELLNALEPIAEKGGNLLSIFHQRGNITPRGHIPVEVDLECHPERFEEIVAALRDRGVNVMETDAERYGEQVSVLLVGDLIGADLSDTLSRVEECAGVSVIDISLSAPEGTDEVASARLRLAAVSGGAGDALSAVREVAESKEIRVVEPLTGGEA